MAWVESRTRDDGGSSYRVCWRLNGGRTGPRQVETFAAGTDAQNQARAEGFLKMVVAAGERWPDGWVKGAGFVRVVQDKPAMPSERSFEEVGLEYVAQIVDCSPGQRTRYRNQIRALATIEVSGRAGTYRPFDQQISAIEEADVKSWLIGWARAPKTKSNYHGLLHGVFTYALERGEVRSNPLRRTAPKRSRIRQSQADLRFLTESEFAATERIAGAAADLLRLAIGTGMRFGEITALWAGDVDLEHRTIRINKAWKRDGDNDEQDIPAWLSRQLRPVHRMRGHHLGNPKTIKSRRTIEVSRQLTRTLERLVGGRLADEFVFVTPTGRPIHNGDFYERVWVPLMANVGAAGVTPFRFHDLRHTHVAWLIAGGVPLPHIQARLGHESITTTIDTYGHLLPVGGDLISEVVDTALRGGAIHPRRALRAVNSGTR